jgi:hypothetical protein
MRSRDSQTAGFDSPTFLFGQNMYTHTKYKYKQKRRSKRRNKLRARIGQKMDEQIQKQTKENKRKQKQTKEKKQKMKQISRRNRTKNGCTKYLTEATVSEFRASGPAYKCTYIGRKLRNMTKNYPKA